MKFIKEEAPFSSVYRQQTADLNEIIFKNPWSFQCHMIFKRVLGKAIVNYFKS